MKVLFVCLGNICRSTMAEALLAQVARDKGLKIKVDSAGTASYHIGSQPDERTLAVLAENGINYSHKARQIEQSDFYHYDYILAMDEQNLEDVLAIEPADSIACIRLVRSFTENSLDVPDPYYGGKKGFYEVYDLLEESIEAFLKKELSVQ